MCAIEKFIKNVKQDSSVFLVLTKQFSVCVLLQNSLKMLSRTLLEYFAKFVESNCERNHVLEEFSSEISLKSILSLSLQRV